jgi:NAD(P)-dependent dehydrogenase (short-subunit alcohol dehydrogenase family)
MPEQSLRTRFLGIGEATVFQFAKYGAASVAISDINLSSLEKVAQRLRDEHPHVEVEVLYIDTSNEQSIIDAHEATIRRFGRIDYAVNNAGVAGPFLPSVDTSREQFMFGIDINMVGVWLCQREQIKHMLKQEGLTPGHVTISSASLARLCV